MIEAKLFVLIYLSIKIKNKINGKSRQISTSLNIKIKLNDDKKKKCPLIDLLSI